MHLRRGTPLGGRKIGRLQAGLVPRPCRQRESGSNGLSSMGRRHSLAWDAAFGSRPGACRSFRKHGLESAASWVLAVFAGRGFVFAFAALVSLLAVVFVAFISLVSLLFVRWHLALSASI